MSQFNLLDQGITVEDIQRNLPPARLYEQAIRTERDTVIADSGALIAYSGTKTGRSPKDKRVVKHPDSAEHVWWGSVNVPIEDATFQIRKERAIDYLNTRGTVYVVDAYAGWDPDYWLKVRVICSLPYHALFMHTMLIRPTRRELEDFGRPDAVILNAGQFPANRHTTGMTSKTSVELNLETRELVILGTEYAGEMKKGVFTMMNYFMPRREVLSMHCSATADKATGRSSVLFGLSGTGKTTLSALGDRQDDLVRNVISSVMTNIAGPTRGSSTSKVAATPRPSTLHRRRNRTSFRRCGSERYWRTSSTMNMTIRSTSRMTRSHKTPVAPIRLTSSRTQRSHASPDIPPTRSSSRAMRSAFCRPLAV